MKIAVVGLGYVGAVSAACLASKGHQVCGVDINPDKVGCINQGRSAILEPGLEALIDQARKAQRLRATTDVNEAMAGSDVCLVSVATPSRPNGQIDAGHLLRACEQIAAALRMVGKRRVVAIRSSVLPPAFDQCRRLFDTVAPGLADLCVNPEFLREGTALRDFQQPPLTLLGTNTTAAEQLLRAMYADVGAPVFVLPVKEALMVKYASNAFHALKVAFANEIGAICEEGGIDARAVMEVFCKDTQLNVSPRYLKPGFAFGGSCLPKDIRAMVHAARQWDVDIPLISSILLSNEEVIERTVRKIRQSGAQRIGLIGLSFKPNTDDLRESPFVELAERLLGKGYELSIYDPNVSTARLTGANREFIAKAIPHLSRLLVGRLEEVATTELLVVGHHFPGVDELLSSAEVPVLDLTDGVTLSRMATGVALAA